MKMSEQWLREWVNPALSSAELGQQLTMAGLEVDGIQTISAAPEKVVAGLVLSLQPHPNADKLRICSVDVGAPEPLSIVCGASNVVVGGVFPVAMIGAVLPGNFKIKKSKLRGEPSEGMLCSASELGLEAQSDGLYPLDPGTAPGTPVAELIAFEDAVIDIDLTPNRADCFSVRGVAREVAAANQLQACEPEIHAVAATIEITPAVSLHAGAAAPLFAGRVVKGINATAQSPVWLRERLRRAGVRPIRPVVDVTNYVMLELGQPMHCYDLSKVAGGLTVRFAAAGESLLMRPALWLWQVSSVVNEQPLMSRPWMCYLKPHSFTRRRLPVRHAVMVYTLRPRCVLSAVSILVIRLLLWSEPQRC
jgi:phenylalanyl-tRNA synthetase beta chain